MGGMPNGGKEPPPPPAGGGAVGGDGEEVGAGDGVLEVVGVDLDPLGRPDLLVVYVLPLHPPPGPGLDDSVPRMHSHPHVGRWGRGWGTGPGKGLRADPQLLWDTPPPF